MQRNRGTTQRSSAAEDAVLMQSLRIGSHKGDAVEARESLGCQNFSREWKKMISSVFMKVSPLFDQSFLVKRLLLKINKKTLICCTGVPALDFSRDNCLKITVLMSLILVLIFHCSFLYEIM